jgi:hypothetical protein
MRGMSTPKRLKRPADFNQRAFQVFQEAIGEAPKQLEPTVTPEPKKNPHAVELGKLGSKKGGLARARKLTGEKRSEIARKAAKARWGNKKDG